MANKKEVSILLLGIVAILAIVGLVLLFTSPAATGKFPFTLPNYPPTLQTPAPLGYGPIAAGGDFGQARGQMGNAVIISYLEGSNLPPCVNGFRTRLQGGVQYAANPGYECAWFGCPFLAESGQGNAKPVLACSKIA